LSARAAYGAELRRQIEEKERDKKLKRGLGKQIQYQNSQGFENELFGKNQHERTRVAAGLSGQGSNNLVLPPLNMLSFVQGMKSLPQVRAACIHVVALISS
jgi:hypothetical protein